MKVKELILLVGPPGSGKSSYCSTYPLHFRISQDDQGREGHMKLFQDCLEMGSDIIVDRMGFSKEQRNRYLVPAKEQGYTTKIVVLHVPQATCYSRCVARQGHPTIQDAKTASKAIHGFFKKYERVEDNEADVVERLGWDGPKETAIVSDLDGTLANIEHRLHFVRGTDDITERKKDWKSFFNASGDDTVYTWCAEILWAMQDKYRIIIVTARPDEYKAATTDWLQKNDIVYDAIYMRQRDDFRHDSIAKEIILDYELKTRYNILFCLDDRSSVVQLWRKHGLVALQCANGNF